MSCMGMDWGIVCYFIDNPNQTNLSYMFLLPIFFSPIPGCNLKF